MNRKLTRETIGFWVSIAGTGFTVTGFTIWPLFHIMIPLWLALLMMGVILLAFGLMMVISSTAAGDHWECAHRGMRWRCESYGHQVLDYAPFCPRCDTQIIPTSSPSIDVMTGQRNEDAVFECGQPGCGFRTTIPLGAQNLNEQIRHELEAEHRRRRPELPR